MVGNGDTLGTYLVNICKSGVRASLSLGVKTADSGPEIYSNSYKTSTFYLQLPTDSKHLLRE